MRAAHWRDTAAAMLVLLLCTGADGLMDKLGLAGFLVVGSIVLGAAWALVEVRQHEKTQT